MSDTNALTECFRDTLRQLKEDRELAEETLRMRAGTVLYLAGYEAVAPEVKSEIPDVSVVRDTSFRCAASFAGRGKTAVLNFANAYSPGGRRHPGRHGAGGMPLPEQQPVRRADAAVYLQKLL